MKCCEHIFMKRHCPCHRCGGDSCDLWQDVINERKDSTNGGQRT